VYRFRDFYALTPEEENKEGTPLSFLYGDTLNLLDDAKKSKKTSLIITVDATYSGYLLNNRVYPGKFMSDRRSWGTWVSEEKGGLAPFNKPVLTHHNQTDGDPIGRVVGAKFERLWSDESRFKDDFKNPAGRYDLGSGKIVIDAEIMDPDAMLKILDGRYRTVSSGQSSPDAWCSICKHNIGKTQDFCQHYPGGRYEVEVEGTDQTKTVVMYLITGLLDYHEVSFVNIPGNAFAKVTSVADVEDTLKQVEDDLKLPHAQSLGIGTFDKYAQVTLMDSEGHTTELIRPEGADDKIPYSSDNVRGATHVSFIDLEVPASTEGDDKESPDGSMQQHSPAKVAEAILDKVQEGVDALLNKEGSMTTKTQKDAPTPEAPPSKDNKDLTTEEKVQKTLTDTIDQQKEQISELQSLADTRQSQIEARSDELSSTRDALRVALAQQLAFSRVITGHLDTHGVEKQEDFEALVGEYAERTVESLQDAVRDAIPEVRTTVGKLTDNKSEFLFDRDKGEVPVDSHMDKTNQGDPQKDTTNESAFSDEPTPDDLSDI